MSIFSEFRQGLVEGYAEITGALSPEYNAIVNLFIFSILISLYAIFAWKFHKYISKKDLIALNLNQYNKTLHPFLNKLVAIFFYIVEYIIILPFLIFFWFVVLALIIMALSEELTIGRVILISAAMIASIRILAYYEENLSRDLAKIFPFTVLVIFTLTPGFFSVDRILSNLAEAPQLIGNMVYFLAFIIAVELVLRVLDLIISLWSSEEEG